MTDIIEKDLSYKIVGAAYRVRDDLGFGFLEKVYENALVVGLRDIGLIAEQQVPLEVHYLGHVGGTYYADLIVEGRVIVEVKSVERITQLKVSMRPPNPRFRSKMEFLLSCEKKMPNPARMDHWFDGL